ncbi:MAG: GerMN domain-containing protein [Candidatus Nealsonbacteria bacterium]|nr:GerMN domain-containing protein [Candidatus Nealsonbacteria bacterium]
MKKIFILIVALIVLAGLWFGLAMIPTEEREISQRTVRLYYYNEELDRDESGNIACSRKGLAQVVRQIPVSQTPIQDAIKLLLAGQISQDERSQGIATEYPLEGFSLKGASLNNGLLTLEFDDPNNKTVGGSCRVGILWFQIEATAKQFPEVVEVRFLPEDIFQP